MKNRIILVSIGIVLVIGLIFVLNNKAKKTFVIAGIKYAVSLDGEVVSTVPSKGLYEVAVTCENATGKWDYDNWKLKLTNMTNEKAKCSLDFTTITKVNLNDYIISLSGQTQGTGQVVNENGYRYEGKNPNNYISFNNELWRIIGVFDENSHDVSGQHLVKIIREEPIGGLAWDSKGYNDWSVSSLKSLLNGAYYNAQDGTDSGYCYGYSTSVPVNCDYSVEGINDTYRSMIQNVTWYLGGYSSTSATAASFYGYERGTIVYSGRPTEEEGHIGLMYVSDYGYSVLASSCARTTNLSSYGSSRCAGQSWVYKTGIEWTITPNSSNSRGVFNLNLSGVLSYNHYADRGYSIRPVLYLSSSVYKITGDGTISNPYIIGM